jgi:hypothetical protein
MALEFETIIESDPFRGDLRVVVLIRHDDCLTSTA